ncbi:MAG: hypothetical protein WBF20_08790 [Trebonia sp.]|uniref:hypothetical protein n=1 Tax=Trebonia sp. TaxID=2767075 RepID=UPI003C759C1A
MLQAQLPASAAEAAARRDAQAAQLRKRIARNEASQKGLISELAQLGDDTSPAAAYRKRIREHHTELDSQAAALHAHLEAITAQAASENDPTLISELPYAPGSLLQAPDHVREALYAALNLHCTFRGDKQQVTIRATITDTTPGIVAALIADPRTDTGSSKRSPGPLDDPNNSAITTETPRISYAMPDRCEPGGEASSQEAGECLLRHGQLNVVGVTGGELDDDAAGAEDAAPVTPASTRCPSSTTCGGFTTCIPNRLPPGR